jgi:hypothetical protein
LSDRTRTYREHHGEGDCHQKAFHRIIPSQRG